MTQLPEASLRTLSPILPLLGGNPVHCDCNLSWLMDIDCENNPTCCPNSDYCDSNKCSVCLVPKRKVSNIFCQEPPEYRGKFTGMVELLDLCEPPQSSTMSICTTVQTSTQPVEKSTSQTFHPAGINVTSPLAPAITYTPDGSTKFVPTITSIDGSKGPRPPAGLHPVLFALPPVVVVVALGICATVGFKILRRRRQRRPKQPRGQCVNANYGYQDRGGYLSENGTTQSVTRRASGRSARPQPEDSSVQTASTSCYNMASAFQSATTYGTAARATYSPSTQTRTSHQTYTNEEVFCGTPTVDARSMSFFADSSAYGHADQALSEDSLRHDSGSVSPLYKTTGDAIYDA
ncbi:Hypp5948 [Branchiostoma lanceolatum]|uniref:Hypp5948 protein n=1 Tax=Branchiostoma lanceolatum TaxID=7740 RepID=A0A8J9VZZ0_BRALA|nr:Hypp5948 [Branchiostoma lanceolatum]